MLVKNMCVINFQDIDGKRHTQQEIVRQQFQMSFTNLQVFAS